MNQTPSHFIQVSAALSALTVREDFVGYFAVSFSTIENHVLILSCVLGCRGLMLDDTLERLSALSLGHLLSGVFRGSALCCRKVTPPLRKCRMLSGCQARR